MGARAAVFFTLLSTLLFAASPARAGAEGSLLLWQTPQTISGESDVSTLGSLVSAFNMFGSSVAVNGVTFAPFNVTAGSTTASNGNFSFSESPGQLAPNNNFGSASAPFANLSANYRTLLSTAISTTDNNTLSLALSNLTVGATYQVEFWTNQSNFSPNLGNDTTATSTFSVTLDSNTTNSSGGVGQYVIGTFFCGSPTQFINFTGTDLTQAPTVNAFQLRLIPEPSSLWLLLGGALSLGSLKLRARRRR